jgi:hypothetical protein
MTWDNIGKILTVIGLLALNFVAFFSKPFSAHHNDRNNRYIHSP